MTPIGLTTPIAAVSARHRSLSPSAPAAKRFKSDPSTTITALLVPAAVPMESNGTPEGISTISAPVEEVVVEVSSPVASTSVLPSFASPQSKPSLPYATGLHLAPMVRIGTLPSRLLALEYGASLVWGPEIVDKAILGSIRTVDPISGTIKFLKNDRAIFECHPIEKSRLIFQLGSADPGLAVQAAKMVMGDVAGVGLNCGCPKPFSLSGGMGAELLKVPDKLCAILTALVTHIPLPIDAKIRLLPTQPDTLSLVSQILSTGISALTVHCRTEKMRSTEAAMLDRLGDIVQMGKEKGIPVIANGDCFEAKEGEKIMEQTGVTSIMIARGAERNLSCFLPSGPLDPSTVAALYINVAKTTTNHWANSKYCLNAMAATPARRSEVKQGLNKAKSYEDAENVFGIVSQEEREEARVERAGEGRERLERLLPRWMERKKEIEREEAAGTGTQSEVAREGVQVA